MKLIAIDTASSSCSAAVRNEKGIICHTELNTGRKHSQDFLPAVDAMLKDNSLSLADMQAVAVTIGPGSFTGIRIGLATAKAWGQALSLPLIPIVTLDAFGYGINGFSCPVLDARKNEVYTALYENGKRLNAYRAVEPAVLAEELKALHAPIIFSGDAVKVYEDIFREALGENFRNADTERALFMAQPAAELGWQKLQKDETTNALHIDAFYLRLSEAEQKRLDRNAEN